MVGLYLDSLITHHVDLPFLANYLKWVCKGAHRKRGKMEYSPFVAELKAAVASREANGQRLLPKSNPRQRHHSPVDHDFKVSSKLWVLCKRQMSQLRLVDSVTLTIISRERGLDKWRGEKHTLLALAVSSSEFPLAAGPATVGPATGVESSIA